MWLNHTTKTANMKKALLLVSTLHARTVVRECCKGDDESQIIAKKLNTLVNVLTSNSAFFIFAVLVV